MNSIASAVVLLNWLLKKAQEGKGREKRKKLYMAFGLSFVLGFNFPSNQQFNYGDVVLIAQLNLNKRINLNHQIKLKIMVQPNLNKRIKLKFKTSEKKKIMFKEATPGNNKVSVNLYTFKCIL
jgi:hypothetical protein